jgi:hypothetical protein
MRQDLKHRLVTWKNDLHSGEIKKVYISESPVKTGEFIIKLEKTLSETLQGKLNQVSVSNKFLTVGQNDSQKDPAADMYHLNRIIDSLEREFNDRYDQAINETFKDERVHYAELN